MGALGPQARAESPRQEVVEESQELGGRRVGVWWLGGTCKESPEGPHHTVPGRLRVRVGLDSRVIGKV